MNEEFKNLVAMKLRHFTDSTKRRYLCVLRQFEAAITKPLIDVKSYDILEYMSSLKLSDNSLKNTYWALRTCYQAAVDYELIDRNPTLRAKDCISWRQERQVRPTQFFTRDKVVKILDEDKPIRDQALVGLLFGTGIRRSELSKLLLSDIRRSPEGNLYILIRGPKGGKDRKHLLAPGAWHALKPYISMRLRDGAKQDHPIFISSYGSKGPRPISDKTTYRIYKSYTGAAPHSARASFATRLSSLGYQPDQIARALGHTGPTQVKKYIKEELSVDSCIGGKIDFFGNYKKTSSYDLNHGVDRKNPVAMLYVARDPS